MRSRRLLATAICLTICFVSPAAARAAAVAATPTGELISEVPFTVAVTGVADTPGTLIVGFAEIGDGCSSRVSSDEVLEGLPVSGAFSMHHLAVVESPGPQLLCAFLEDHRGHLVAASVAPFTARRPRSDYRVSAPPVVALGRSFRVRVAGGSEAPRSVFGKLAAPGAGCAEGLSSGDIFMSLRAEVTAVDEVANVRLDQYGLWRACVRTERYWTTLDPSDAVSETTIRVTVRCTAASRELSRARDRWRAMSRRLRLRGLAPSPQLRIRGMAVRRARAWVEEACAPGA